MALKFELDIEHAKRKRTKKIRAIILVFMGFFAFTALVFFYLTAFEINVIQKEYKSKVYISTQYGSAIRLGSSRLFFTSDQGQVLISAEGYKSQTLYVTKSQREKVLTVELDYDEAPVKIVKKQQTSNVIWMINKMKVSASDNLDINLRPGLYNLQLISRHYDQYELEIAVQPATGFSAEISLKPVTVSYDIRTSPTASEVYFDGKLVGVSPVTGNIDSRIVKVRISKPKYADLTESVDLSQQDGLLSRSYSLTSAQQSLQVSYHPKGGRLFANNREVIANALVAIKESSDTKLRYSRPGYHDQTITVKPGTVRILFDLAPQYGEVFITTNIKANVYQGKKYLGKTPFNQKFLAV